MFAFFDSQTDTLHSNKPKYRDSFIEVPTHWSIESCMFFARNCLVSDVVPCRLGAIEDADVPTWLRRKAAKPVPPSMRQSKDVFQGETSVRGAIDRLAGGWTYFGWQGGYFDAEEDARTFYDEIRWLLCHRQFTPDLVEWQQTGVYWAYGIETNDLERYVTDFRTGLVRRSGGHEVSSTKEQSAQKKLRAIDGSHPDAIDDVWADSTADAQEATQLMGYAIATRHIQAIIDAYRESKGSTDNDREVSASMRWATQAARGAFVPEYLISRTLELVAQNCEITAQDIIGPAVTENSGQADTATIICLEDGPIDLAVDGNDKAYQLFDTIAYGTWTGRKTGIHYTTTVNGWNPCPEAGDIYAAGDDPAYLFLAETECNRATIDCTAFRESNSGFAVEAFCHAVELITTVADIGHMRRTQRSPRSASRTWDYRPLGLSVTGVAELVMSYGLPYDSEDARAIGATICSLFTATAYKQSAAMAAELGAFPSFKQNRDSMLRVIRNHRRAAESQIGGYEGLGWAPHPVNPQRALPELYEAAVKTWEIVQRLGEEAGYRNAQVTLISSELDANPILKSNALGLEPVPALCKHQHNKLGQHQPTIADAVGQGLISLGYSRMEIDRFVEALLGTRSLKNAPSINHSSLKKRGFTEALIEEIEKALVDAIDLSQVFNPWILGKETCIEILGVNGEELECPSFDLLAALGFSDEAINKANQYCFGNRQPEELPYRDAAHAVVFITAESARQSVEQVEATIRMMASIQPMISGGIGQVIALPHSTTVADCHVLFLTGWRLGLKSLCLYRDELGHWDTPEAAPTNHGSNKDTATQHTKPSLTVIQGGQTSANTGAMTQMKSNSHVPEFSNNKSPAEMSQALAMAHATRRISPERTPIKEPPGKDRTAITLSAEETMSDAETSRRSASDTARSAAPGSSSPDAAVEQRHI